MSESVVNMPVYVSHKKVRALKIAWVEWPSSVKRHPDDEDPGGCILHFVDSVAEPLERDGLFAARVRRGLDPGYYVLYEDGYASWSPTKAFEEGYTRHDLLNAADTSACETRRTET